MDWSAIAQAGAGIVGGLVSGLGSRRRAGRQFRHNKALAEYSFDRQKEMWDEQWRRETEYNSPLAQMGRLKQAGINPHMAYAKGGATNTAQTGSLPEYRQEANDVGMSGGEVLGGVLSNYLSQQSVIADVRKKKAQASQEEINAEILAEGLQTKKRTEWERTQNKYLEEKQKSGTLYGDTGKGLSRYQRGMQLDLEFKELQNLVAKSQKHLNEITASNLITNDQLVEMQTQVAKAQFDFLKSDWFKELPPAIKATFMALANKLAGVK